MKNKLFKTSLISLIIIMLLQVASFAAIDKLTLKTLTDKDTYTVGDNVTVTIEWTEKMECAEFYIKFDSTKLEFKKATYIDGRELKDEFTNVIEEGNLKFGYFGDESTKMLFVFETKAAGKTTISVSDPGGFADGNLDEPNSYDVTTYGSKEIIINAKEENKPNEGTDTEDDTPTKPGEGENTGDNTPTKPGEGENEGNNTPTKPSEGTNTGNNTPTKPNEGTNTGNNTPTKPSEGTNTGNNTPTTPNKGDNTVNKPSTSNKVDNTTASGKMPQTGAENLVLVIALVAIVGTIGFVKYRRLSDI